MKQDYMDHQTSQEGDQEITLEQKQRIEEEADAHGFVVPYDGSNNFYRPNAVESYRAGATHERELANDELAKSNERIKELERQIVGEMDTSDRNARERNYWKALADKQAEIISSNSEMPLYRSSEQREWVESHSKLIEELNVLKTKSNKQ